MKTLFRATAILGSASVVTILIGVVSAKVTAVLLGPAGFGLMALFQTVVSFATLLAGLGTQAGLVREGARAIADGDRSREHALYRAAWLIGTAMGMATAVAMIVFRDQISWIALDTPDYGIWIALLAPAVLFSLWALIQGSILNAQRRVGDLARISVLSAAISLMPTIVLVWRFGRQGVAPAAIANFLVLWLVSLFFYVRARRRVPERAVVPPATQVRAAARTLLGFGIPYMGSMLVGAGVLMVLPILVLHALGSAEVGLFRAASSIAINYLAILLSAMAQDYFPRVAGASDDPATLNGIINDQLRLILLIGGPAILGMLAVTPYLVHLLYSSKFAGAADLLEWQLIGDLFKFATWTMSFVVMARLGGRTFFLTEFAGGTLLLLSSWLGMVIWGLPGLGIAFLVTGACVFLLYWAVLWHRMVLRWNRANVVLFACLAAAMAVVRILPDDEWQYARTLIAGGLASAFAAYSATTILREFGGWTAVKNWRKSR